jgi:hypothetical protein
LSVSLICFLLDLISMPIISPPSTPRQAQRSSCLVQSILLRKCSSSSDLPQGDFQELFDILDNPISCGYLYTFCESEYNSESIRFIIIVDEFKDVLKRDFGCWKLNWKEVDRSLKISGHQMESGAQGETPAAAATAAGTGADWPSQKVFETEARNKANEIFSEFICHTASSQICLATEIFSRTLYRIRYLHLYGPSTFDEALLDPFRTLKRDILPRFKNSPLYEEMLSREKYLMSDVQVTQLRVPELPTLSAAYHPYYAKTLRMSKKERENQTQSHREGARRTGVLGLKMLIGKKDSVNLSTATTSATATATAAPTGHRFELHDFLTYTELFEFLRDYMKKLFCVENLWCYRMIELYERQASLAAAVSSKNISTAITTLAPPPPRPPSLAAASSGFQSTSMFGPAAFGSPRDSTSEGKVSRIGKGPNTAAHIAKKLKNMAWEIYRYFVAEHSLFEVSLLHSHRKRIMIQMAAPHATIFDPIKQSVLQSINTIFQKFVLTEEYLLLSQTLKSNLLLAALLNTSSTETNWRQRYFSCFITGRDRQQVVEGQRGKGETKVGTSSVVKKRFFHTKLFPEEDDLPTQE